MAANGAEIAGLSYRGSGLLLHRYSSSWWGHEEIHTNSDGDHRECTMSRYARRQSSQQRFVRP